MDKALFTINIISGALSFVEAPDYENPKDANGDNLYDITISAFDGFDETDSSIRIEVTDVWENRSPSELMLSASSLFENLPGGSIVGHFFMR